MALTGSQCQAGIGRIKSSIAKAEALINALDDLSLFDPDVENNSCRNPEAIRDSVFCCWLMSINERAVQRSGQCVFLGNRRCEPDFLTYRFRQSLEHMFESLEQVFVAQKYGLNLSKF
jgi:hypothetical protein